jgi:hypothetical protein
MTKTDNATQGKSTTKQRIPSSVDDPHHAYYPTGNWLGDVPSLHRRRRSHLHLLSSLLHNLAKLIARDKAMSTFWIVLANHLREKNVHMLYGCSKGWLSFSDYVLLTSRVDIACPMTFLYPYWRKLLEAFSKISRKGGTPLKGKIGGQSNMTNSSRRQYPPSTPNHFLCHGSTLQVLRSTPVPRQHPPSTPFGTKIHFSRKPFIKPKPYIGQCSDLHNRPWPRTRLFE